MKGSTAHNHAQRLRRGIDSIFSDGRFWSKAHDQILVRVIREIYEDPAWTKLPQYVRAALSERISMRFEEIYDRPPQNTVVWQLYLDGQRVESANVPQGRWVDVHGRHEWKNTGAVYSEEEKE